MQDHRSLQPLSQETSLCTVLRFGHDTNPLLKSTTNKYKLMQKGYSNASFGRKSSNLFNDHLDFLASCWYESINLPLYWDSHKVWCVATAFLLQKLWQRPRLRITSCSLKTSYSSFTTPTWRVCLLIGMSHLNYSPQYMYRLNS